MNRFTLMLSAVVVAFACAFAMADCPCGPNCQCGPDCQCEQVQAHGCAGVVAGCAGCVGPVRRVARGAAWVVTRPAAVVHRAAVRVHQRRCGGEFHRHHHRGCAGAAACAG